MPRPTRDIDEIVQLHAREGSAVQEVFVEGKEDKCFYESFLTQTGLKHVAVLEIGTVNVPDGRVLALGQKVGEKGRVVTLAALLQGRVTQSQVVCIADADTDHFRGVAYPYLLLLLTDYTSIELYVLCPSVMQRIMDVALRGFPKGYAQVTAELAQLLQEAFVVRVAAEDLGLGPAYPDHHRFCAFDKRRRAASFRAADYINKAFEEHHDKSWRDPLNEKIAERRGQLRRDARLQMHGHDFANTFTWFVRQHPGFGHINPATFAGVLLGFVDTATLSSEPLFRELVRRLKLVQ
jgi:hypothetical protein